MDNKYEIYDVEAKMFKCNENYPNMIGFTIHWTSNLGFGKLNFYYDTEKNEWECDSECMSKEFCKEQKLGGVIIVQKNKERKIF